MSRRGLVTYSQRVSEPRNINYEENVASGRAAVHTVPGPGPSLARAADSALHW